MSIFDTLFKLNSPAKTELKQKSKAINIIIDSTHNKLTISEAERLYDLINSDAMSLSNDYDRITKGMAILTEAKADWLTDEEKESFVAGVWLCECGRDKNNNKGVSYINSEELKYTRQAVLGSIFKSNTLNID